MKAPPEEVSKELLAFVRQNRICIDRLTKLLAQIDNDTKEKIGLQGDAEVHPRAGDNEEE